MTPFPPRQETDSARRGQDAVKPEMIILPFGQGSGRRNWAIAFGFAGRAGGALRSLYNYRGHAPSLPPSLRRSDRRLGVWFDGRAFNSEGNAERKTDDRKREFRVRRRRRHLVSAAAEGRGGGKNK